MTATGMAARNDLLLRLWKHLERRRRRQFWALVGAMPFSAMAEVISLGAVFPFLGILIAPDRALRHPVVARFADLLGVTTADQLVLPLTIAFVATAILAGVTRLLLLLASTRLAVAAGADLSIAAYRRTLYQPYAVHVGRNSSEVISGITNKVNGVVFGVVLPLLNFITSVTVVVAVTLALFFINPVVAFLASIGFGGAYVMISWFARRRLRSNSRRIAVEQTQVVKALQEGLGGIRDVLLDGSQSVYCDIYRQADVPLRRAQGNNTFIGQSPRFAVESIGMVLIATLAYLMSRQEGGIANALPVLGALALGAQRLLPALQQAYSTWASIAGSHDSLADIIELLDQPLPPDVSRSESVRLPFVESICLDRVRFRYGGDGPWVLDGVNLVIPKGSRVGVVGVTGSGKSTLMDLLLGLLTPTEGALLVDGTPVVGRALEAWQRTIAHVPQSIYLADATLAENIAFGIPRAAIDLDRVRRSARQAQVSDFIESRPEGYDALVGERGVRLSGGQRQRIGIARALYKEATVLVFDEATSALDSATEKYVMDAIEGLGRDLTIVLIAHRLTTVARCDRVVEVEQGRVTTREDLPVAPSAALATSV